MNRLAINRSFPLVELLVVVVGGALWTFAGGKLSWQPLLLLLVPWIIRISAGLPPFRRTPFDALLLFFLIMAAVGVWAAYDQDMAWRKFWVIVGAVFFYYALVGQLRRDVWLVAGLLGSIGALVAGYFLLTHDWQAWPADIDFLTQLGRRWMAIRPTLSTPALHPNIAGGIMAVMVPFLVAFGLHVWQRRSGLVWLAVGMGGVIALGLLLTSSRAAWLSLIIAMGIWFLWEISRFASVFRLPRQAVFVSVLVVLCGLGLWLIFSFDGGVSALIGSLPGPDGAINRLDLYRQTWDMVGDFPFTGGGLNAFAGLYSNYIMVIPFFLFDYSHNLFLDVLLEQGILGLLSLVVMIGGSFWLLLVPVTSNQKSKAEKNRGQPKGMQTFRWAVFAGLVTMGLHGMVDDALYGSLGTPLIFFLPGMAVVTSGISRRKKRKHRRDQDPIFSRRTIVAIVIIFVIVIELAYSFRLNLTSTWYANLGAVEMARIELAGWPSNEWDDGRNVAALEPAAGLFQRALYANPGNRTAQHRLGQIAMLKRDYDAAIGHLEAAYSVDDEHRGIVKSLGFSYAWAGELEKATEHLAGIQEARGEMETYSWWWQAQGREDLAERARQMMIRLDGAAAIRP